MSTAEYLNSGLTMMLLMASFVTSLILPAEISIIILVVSYSTAVYAVSYMIKNDYGWHTRALYFFWALTFSTIVIFAVIYWRYGLISNGEKVAISMSEAFYFSVTTWTTLGYGDFAPPPRIRHITSIQAILGYIGLGTLVVLLNGFIKNMATPAEDDPALREYFDKKQQDEDE